MIPLGVWLKDCPEVANLRARDITLDSREVSKGDVFIALKGESQDGHDYVESAVKAGAVAVVAEHQVAEAGVPVAVPPDLRRHLGELAHTFYGAPSESLNMIGITGTNGKTSTCQYVAQSLDFLGKRCGIIGTNGQGLWGALQETLNTTPDVVRLHRELARQRDQGGRFCAMEVSSHGLHQGRVEGVRYKTAVFTNLSRDHLDYHGTMEAYGNAKWRLLQWPGLVNAIVNIDDNWVQQHLDSIKAERILTFGYSMQAEIRVVSHRPHPAGIDAVVATPWGATELNLPLLGQFNLSNALAVLAVLLTESVPLSTAACVLSALRSVEGRMELIKLAAGPSVVVDYAHTPDALGKALEACRDHVAGRLGVVFGCGGDRDKGKRPLMAAAAEQGADFVVVTSDNPRSEKPTDILADIRRGFSYPERVMEIQDRRTAIEETLSRCSQNDVVLIAGKGHEAYQEINGKRHCFSDQKTVLAWKEAGHVE